MVVMKSIPAIGGIDCLENLRVTIAQRICRPSILEIDVAIAIQVPDEVTLRFVENDLPDGAKAALSGSIHLGVESQAIFEKGNAAFECRERLGARKNVFHSAYPRNCQNLKFRTRKIKMKRQFKC